MKKYRGYYIDNVIYHNEAEIDEALKRKAVERFEMLNKYFEKHPTMEACKACTEQAQILHEQHGFTYSEIEALEIAAIA